MEGFSLHADTWLHENDVTGLERAPTPSPFGHPRPAPLPASARDQDKGRDQWFTAWGTSQQPNVTPEVISNATVRMIARVTIPGSAIRIRLDNTFSTSPVTIGHAFVATGLIVRKSVGAKTLGGLAGKNIAAVAGTPNLRALEDALKKGLVNAKVVPAKTYDEAIALLEGGKADALAAGKTMLLGIGSKLKDPGAYDLLNDDFGYVPYAIVLPLGASRLRLAVNRALSQIYDSQAIAEIFRGAFGPNAKPSGALLVMYGLNVYPE